MAGKENQLVFGVGKNDADYPVTSNIGGKRVMCPFYRRWVNMLKRCYSPCAEMSYNGCVVCPEWLLFSKFRAWMQEQDWEGKDLDKDFLSGSEKIYSPETCSFISHELNSLLLSGGNRNGLLVGVSKRGNRYEAKIRESGKARNLGRFDTQEDAHAAWYSRKRELVHQFASTQKDVRIRDALLARFP